MKERKVIYEPHPVSPERKAELIEKGYKIIDSIFEPKKQEAPVVPAKADKVVKDAN